MAWLAVDTTLGRVLACDQSRFAVSAPHPHERAVSPKEIFECDTLGTAISIHKSEDERMFTLQVRGKDVPHFDVCLEYLPGPRDPRVWAEVFWIAARRVAGDAAQYAKIPPHCNSPSADEALKFVEVLLCLEGDARHASWHEVNEEEQVRYRDNKP